MRAWHSGTKVVRWGVGVVALVALMAAAAACGGEEPTAAPAGGAQPQAEKTVYEWVYTNSGGGTVPRAQDERLKATLFKATGGQLVLKLNEAGSIVPPYRELQGIQEGVVDMASTWIGAYPADIGLGAALFGASIAVLPYAAYMAWYNTDEAKRLFLELVSGHDVGYFAVSTWYPPEHFGWCKDTKIQTLADLQGKRYRAGGYYAQVITELGGSGQFLAVPEVFSALERGVLDCGEIGGPQYDYAMAFYDVAKYVHVPGIHQEGSAGVWLISKKAWAQLPPDLQETVALVLEATGFRETMVGIIGNMEGYHALTKVAEYVRLPKDLQQIIYEKSIEIVTREAVKQGGIHAEIWKSMLEFDALYQPFNNAVNTYDYVVKDYSSEIAQLDAVIGR